jgi:hypothetical protein
VIANLDRTRIAYLDIETRKIDAGPGFPQRRRWQPFMVGLGLWSPDRGWKVYLLEEGGKYGEAFLIDALASVLRDRGIEEIRYGATREFDEMVLRGRFTNARRAHLPEPPPWWPNLNEFPVRWVNVARRSAPTPRAPRGSWDCASKDCPALWDSDRLEYRARVRAHCLADVSEMIGADPLA